MDDRASGSVNVTAYRKFSDIIRSRHLGADNVPPPKTPNQTDDDGQSARALGGLATLGAILPINSKKGT